MRDRLTRVKDIAKDVERGSRDVKALAWCICALADEVRELKEGADDE